MLIWLNLLLLCFVSYNGTATLSVRGKKGDIVTLPCHFETREVFHIILITRSEIISVCETEECRGRVFKEGNCDVVIKNLIFSDAGKYTLDIYYNNDQTELERQIRKYQLHIHDEVSVNMGEQLKLDVLLSEADEVQHQRRRSTDWMKVWSRSDGVQSQRISIRDRNLIISNFTARDTGSYRVLDTEGEILITVTVTESKETLEHTDDSKYHTVWICILTPALSLCLCFWFWWFWTFFKLESSLKHERLHRNVEGGSKESQFSKL